MFFNRKAFNFEGDTKTWQSRNDTDGKDVIEFVTSPNNPKYLGSIALVKGKSFTSDRVTLENRCYSRSLNAFDLTRLKAFCSYDKIQQKGDQ
nr:tryptophan aminotransferase-related protein 3-like [Tanacetum cinerariifolium]